MTTEYEKYAAALHTFRDKYFAVPGDMTNATAFWGTAAVCPGDADDASGNATTCNGDGDGIVNRGATTSNEEMRAWQHLANAGLIEGSYTGVTTNTTTATAMDCSPGVNIPASKVSNAGWYLDTIGTGGQIAISDTSYFEGSYNNVFRYGKLSGVSPGIYPAGVVVKPEEMWNIDTKIDDGKPGSGGLVTLEGHTLCFLLANGSPGSTSNSAARADSQYNLKESSVSCAMIFRNIY